MPGFEFKDNVIEWLLEDENPSVKYRTLVELLGKPQNSDEVIKAKAGISSSKNVTNIFSKLDNNGLWPHKPKYYGGFTTFFFLGALAELGLNKDDPRIARVVNWMLSPDERGDTHFGGKHFTEIVQYGIDVGDCDGINVLTALIKLGYFDDTRIQIQLEHFRMRQKYDGGYLCIWRKGKHKDREPKSCITACTSALMLYAALPGETHEWPEFKKLKDYFVKRNIIYSTMEPGKVVGYIPTVYTGVGGKLGIVSYAYALSVLGYGNRKELDDIWNIIDTKKDKSGKYIVEYTSTKPPFNVGLCYQPNKWITLYTYLAYKCKGLK